MKKHNTHFFEDKCMWMAEQGFETSICEIEYRIIGRHYFATLEDPEEHPELEIVSVMDLVTGDDVTDLIVGIDKVEELAWNDMYTKKHMDYNYHSNDDLDD